MPPPPAISVVMPVYNGERFVEEAIASVLGQTCTDFEFIVVDDGSTDSTPALLRRYAQTDSRIRVLQQPGNTGITACLNWGCAEARGAYIARMDADDIALPHRFARQRACLDADPSLAAVGSAVQLIDAQGRPGATKRYPLQPDLVAWSMLFFNSVAHPAVMMRRSVLDAPDAYPDAYPRAEDYALFFRLSLQARVANLPDVLLHYRTWPGNVSKCAEQDSSARRVVRDTLLTLGITVTDDDAGALQGLSRERYPAGAAAIRCATVIQAARAGYIRHFRRRSVEAIDRDAGVKLCLLALRAGSHSCRAAAAMAVSAVAVSPGAPVHFACKVGRRLVAALGGRA